MLTLMRDEARELRNENSILDAQVEFLEKDLTQAKMKNFEYEKVVTGKESDELREDIQALKLQVARLEREVVESKVEAQRLSKIGQAREVEVREG